MKHVIAIVMLAVLVGCSGPIPFNHQPPCEQYESHVDRNLCNAKHHEG